MKSDTDVPLGYIFHRGQSQFGYEQFDVFLTDKPSEQHFDPDEICVMLGTARGAHPMEISHPWQQAPAYQVCAGRIVVADRFHKRVEVFTLGGQVTINTEREHTECIFTSPAPFLDMTTGHSVATLLSNEIEILLAQRRAAHNFHFPNEFDTLLLKVDPLIFYACCLETVREKFAHLPYYHDPVVQHLKHQLHLEIDRLQQEGQWPQTLPELNSLI
jgi:hypothetical protein